MRVQFDKNGWYHPAYGRLGRGRNKGVVYELPDAFAEPETVDVDVMDNSSRPPRKIGTKQITRYTHLPSTATVIDDDTMEELREQALDANEPEPKPTRPRTADQEELNKVTGRGKVKQAQSAQERTTGSKRPSRRRAST